MWNSDKPIYESSKDGDSEWRSSIPPFYITDFSSISRRSHRVPTPSIMRRTCSAPGSVSQMHDLSFEEGRNTMPSFYDDSCEEKVTPKGNKKYFIYGLLLVFISVNVMYDARNIFPSTLNSTYQLKEEKISNRESSGKSEKEINEFSSSLQLMHSESLSSPQSIPLKLDVEEVVQKEDKFLIQKVVRDLTTSLPSSFLDLKSIGEFEETSQILPFFWETVPRMEGKYRMTWFLDECFDLNRASSNNQDGMHPVVIKSKKRPLEIEDVMSGRDLIKSLNIYESENKKGLIFSLFLHPVQRAALLFEHIRREKDHPLYNEKFASINLLTFVKLLKTSTTHPHIESFRNSLGNWYTRSLSFSKPSTVLGENHLMEAKTMLQEKCLVGRFDFLPASLKRFKKVLHINDNLTAEEQNGINSCLEPFISSPMVQNPIVPGSDEWKALASLNNYDIQLYDRALEIFEEQGNLPVLSKESNGLTAGLQHVSQIKPLKKLSPLQFPFFWDTVPTATGKKPVVSFFDVCLDLTRAVVDAPNGGHRIVYQSRTQYNPSNTQEDIISSYNFRESRKIFKVKDANHKKGTFFSFFMHPVQRSALIFNQYREFKTDPNYDSRIEGMSLKDLANVLLSDSNLFPTLRYKMSNFLLKSLTENSSSNDVDSAFLMLKERCVVGLVEEMQDSMSRFGHILQINRNNKNDIKSCVSPYVEQADSLHPIKEDSEEWRLLEKLNKGDIQLYLKVKQIYNEQGQTLFSVLHKTN